MLKWKKPEVIDNDYEKANHSSHNIHNKMTDQFDNLPAVDAPTMMSSSSSLIGIP